MDFPDMIQTLESYGVADVLLPFLLIFTLVYAILLKTKILGPEPSKTKNFNVIIALVMALAVVIPHVLGRYPPGGDVVDIMNSALPNVSIVIIAIFMVMLLLGLFGWESMGLSNNAASGWIVTVALIIVTYIFGSSAGWWSENSWLSSFLNEETKSLVLIILIFGVIIWFITKEEKPAGTPSAAQNFAKGFAEIFKPNKPQGP